MSGIPVVGEQGPEIIPAAPERQPARGLRRWAIEQAVQFAEPGGGAHRVVDAAKVILSYVTGEKE